MKNQVAFAVLSTSIISGIAFSGTMGPLEKSPSWMKVMTITVGSDFIQKANSQTLTLLPPFQNHYTVSSAHNTIADGGIFLGLEHPLNAFLKTQVGLSGYFTSKDTIKGDVWQFALQRFDNLTYRYRVENQRLMASGKLVWINYPQILPYLLGEIGIGFNETSGYQEKPIIPQAVPMAPFASHNSSSLTWAAGLGMDYQVSARMRFGAGWQFANLGKASLGLSPAEQTTQTLTLSHRYANQLRFQFTYLV